MNALDQFPLDQKSWSFLNLIGQTPLGLTGGLGTEGTVTAAFSALTSGTITINPSIQTLAYHKMGKRVYITGFLNVNSVSSPVGRLRITGLPFTAPVGNQFDAAVIPFTSSLTSNVALVGSVPSAQNFIDLFRLTTPTTDDAAALVQAGSNFIFSFFYFTA